MGSGQNKILSKVGGDFILSGEKWAMVSNFDCFLSLCNIHSRV
jgi:hypothetical protein